jgi:hypothetical protein
MNVCMQAKISLFRFNLSTSKQVLLIYQSAVLTLTSVHAYMSLSMAVSESRALRKLSKKNTLDRKGDIWTESPRPSLV